MSHVVAEVALSVSDLTLYLLSDNSSQRASPRNNSLRAVTGTAWVTWPLLPGQGAIRLASPRSHAPRWHLGVEWGILTVQWAHRVEAVSQGKNWGL